MKKKTEFPWNRKVRISNDRLRLQHGVFDYTTQSYLFVYTPILKLRIVVKSEKMRFFIAYHSSFFLCTSQIKMHSSQRRFPDFQISRSNQKSDWFGMCHPHNTILKKNSYFVFAVESIQSLENRLREATEMRLGAGISIRRRRERQYQSASVFGDILFYERAFVTCCFHSYVW